MSVIVKFHLLAKDSVGTAMNIITAARVTQPTKINHILFICHWMFHWFCRLFVCLFVYLFAIQRVNLPAELFNRTTKVLMIDFQTHFIANFCICQTERDTFRWNFSAHWINEWEICLVAKQAENLFVTDLRCYFCVRVCECASECVCVHFSFSGSGYKILAKICSKVRTQKLMK